MEDSKGCVSITIFAIHTTRIAVQKVAATVMLHATNVCVVIMVKTGEATDRHQPRLSRRH